MNTLWTASEFLPTQGYFRMKPKAAYACCSQFRKARRGKWKLSSGWAAKRWLWLPSGQCHPFIFLFACVDGVCMAVLELCGPSPPFSLPGSWPVMDHTCNRSSAAPSPRWGLDCGVLWAQIWLTRGLKCLRLCFLLGNHLGLVCPSAGHYPSQGSLQSCFYPWSVASSGLSSWSPSHPFIGKLPCGVSYLNVPSVSSRDFWLINLYFTNTKHALWSDL